MDRIGLRQTVVDLLLNKTSAGARVFRSKPTPVDGDKTPEIVVHVMRSDSGQITGKHVLTFKPTHEIKIECYVAAAVDWDDAADTLIDEVEAALFQDPAASLLDCGSVTSYSIDLAYSDNGEVPIACGIMTIAIENFVTLTINDSPIPDFLKMHIDVDLEPTDGTIEATTEFDLEPA